MTDKPAELYMEIEVELVRTVKVVFSCDPNHGISNLGSPAPVGRVLRAMQFWMHCSKNLVTGEKPRLLSWRFMPEHDINYEGEQGYSGPCECQDRLDAAVKESMEEIRRKT